MQEHVLGKVCNLAGSLKRLFPYFCYFLSQIGTYLYYMLLFDSNHITLLFDITTVEPPCLTTSHKQPPIQNTKYFPSQILIVETSSKWRLLVSNQ